MENEVELTQAQIDRQDFVDNAIEQLIRDLTGKEFEHDMEWLGDVRDYIEGLVCDRLGLMTVQEFYPSISLGELYAEET